VTAGTINRPARVGQGSGKIALPGGILAKSTQFQYIFVS
jgi:hypothetical protein